MTHFGRMMRAAMPKSALAFLLAVLAFPARSSAADWPRFRGPNGAGVAETSALPDSIGPDRHVVWKTALPPGHSSPAISGDHIFLTAFEGNQLFTLALDRGNGRILWRRESPRDRHEKLDAQNSPASPTPAADGHNVYVFFPDYGLLSYTSDGKERWRTPLGPFDNMCGMGVSPILAGDKVVLICDQQHNSFAAAFSQGDGEQVWKTRAPKLSAGIPPRSCIGRKARKPRAPACRSSRPVHFAWMPTISRPAKASGG